jgi:hypothetical protein
MPPWLQTEKRFSGEFLVVQQNGHRLTGQKTLLGLVGPARAAHKIGLMNFRESKSEKFLAQSTARGIN